MFKLHIRVPYVLLGFILCATTLTDASSYEESFQARKTHLLSYLADGWGNGQPFPNFSDVHKHYWSSAIAVIESKPEGILHPQVNDGDATSGRPPRYWGILKYDGEAATGLVSNATRGTGSNVSFSWNPNVFHFIFPGLAYLMGMYPDIPAWSDPHHRDANLTYRSNYLRYVLTRTDNYNAFTGEGTENHINMSRPSAWVLASEAERLGYSFSGQPASAAQRANEMRSWIMGWSRRIYEVGIGEWDSGTYYMVSLQGWLAAYDYAGTEHGWDPEVRAAARAVIDFYAATLAIKHNGFHFAGAESRSGRNFSRMDNGTAYLAYLWFADTVLPPPDWRGNQAAEAVYAAVSSYRPPAHLVALARKGPADHETYHALKPSYLLQDAAQTVEVVHLGPGYTLGSANMNIGSFHSSTWQIVPWKMMITGASPTSFPAVVSGNGGFYGAGILNTRDPWMQIVQHRNVLIQLHRVPSDATAIVSAVQAKYNEWKVSWYDDFLARWPAPDWGGFNGDTFAGRRIPLNFQATGGNVVNARTAHISPANGSSLAVQGFIRFAQSGATYIAVRSIRNPMPALTNGRFTDTGDPDQLFGLIMEVGTQQEFGSFENFQNTVIQQTELDLSERDTNLSVTYTALSGDVIQAWYQESGTWIEPDYDWNYGVSTPGGVSLMHAHPWRQPDWPQGSGHGRQPLWSLNGIIADPLSWDLIDGPRLRVRNGKLDLLNEGKVVYSVDYSAELPVFSMLVPVPSIEANAQADASVSFFAERGLRYTVQTSLDLVEWDNLTPAFDGNNEIYMAPIPSDIGTVFVRIKVTP